LALQRALSFLPGDWNPKAKGEANASSDWRGRMKELFYKEYFPKNPLLGSGYHYNPVFAKQDEDVYAASIEKAKSANDVFFDVRGFIERREPHEGLVHALLVSGLLGTSFFVAYCLALLLFCFRNLRRTPRKEISPIQTWAISLLFTLILAFYLLGGDYSSFFLLVCPISALLFRVDQLLVAKEIA
jgi:O-antigen ligase